MWGPAISDGLCTFLQVDADRTISSSPVPTDFLPNGRTYGRCLTCSLYGVPGMGSLGIPLRAGAGFTDTVWFFTGRSPCQTAQAEPRGNCQIDRMKLMVSPGWTPSSVFLTANCSNRRIGMDWKHSCYPLEVGPRHFCLALRVSPQVGLYLDPDLQGPTCIVSEPSHRNGSE